jgi:hypothetical protein
MTLPGFADNIHRRSIQKVIHAVDAGGIEPRIYVVVVPMKSDAPKP